VLDGEILTVAEIHERLQGRVVGFSPTQVSYGNSLALAAEAKRRGAIVVFGGHHATALASEILANRIFVDAVVVGDGEEAFAQLVMGTPFEAIPNLAFRAKEGRIVRTRQHAEDLDSIAIPDRSLVDNSRYHSNFVRQNPSKGLSKPASLYTQKGCSWRDLNGGCSFCARTDVGWRARSVDSVWREVRLLVEQLEVDYLWELSDDVLSDLRWFQELVNRKPADLNPALLLYARPARVNDRTADLLARIGAREVFLGVESGDDALLKQAQKGSTTYTNRRAARLLKQRGIRVFPSFVLGLEGESRASLVNTRSHVLELLDGGLVDTVAFSTFMPLPGSAGYSRLLQKPIPGAQWRGIDNPNLREMQETWCREFCSLELEEIEELRQELVALVPQASGLVTFRPTDAVA